MPSFAYDKTHNPPAITCEVEVSTKLFSSIGIGNNIATRVTMLIDTGADISIIPKITIRELERSIGKELPYGLKTVEDYNGEKFKHKSYELILTLLNIDPNNVKSGELLVIESDQGILGRDILNNYYLYMNGPKLQWGYLKGRK